MSRHSPHGEALRALFSIAFFRALIDSFGYYLHEQVVWRRHLHRKGGERIHATASLRNAHNIYIGTNSHINHGCCIWAGETSKIVLGDNLLMGPGVTMFSGNHGMSRNEPMTFQPRREADITIGNDVWLGSGVTITAGVTIADGVVVAAGAVVTKSIDTPYAIAGGIPARVIGQRV